jgi:hypothetical protein
MSSRELLHRPVSSLWFLAQSHQHDIVQIANQPSPELLRLAVADRAYRLGCDRDLRRSFWARNRIGAADNRARLFWLMFANHPFHLLRRRTRGAVGTVAGQEFIKDEAQRVHVAHRRDGFPAHLLGAGVSERHRTQPCYGGRSLLRGRLRIEQFGDPEVEQFGDAFGGNQEVAGLEVAVEDVVLMSILDRGTSRAEQREPLHRGQFVFVAVEVHR